MTKRLCYDDGFTFQFDPPSEGRTLRSVAIVDGAPELRFDRSEHTPSLTADDVAIICRLVSEGVRPQFTFVGLPFGHPFYGRQYKHYDPPWLKDTPIGELLFEVDWKMKCIGVGIQTDQTKSLYFSREKTSKTKGLATTLDFTDSRGGSIFLTCGEVPVQMYDDELVLNVDPKLSIEAASLPNYARYLTRILPQIAKHDEPLFTKLQEVVKMLLAAEWLRDRGIEMSKNWMTDVTRNSNKQIVTVEKHNISCKSADPSFGEGSDPSLNISPTEEEAKNYKKAAAESTKAWYGYMDVGGGEVVQFTEDGKLCAEIKSERTSITRFMEVNGEKMNLEDWMKRGHLQLPAVTMSTPDVGDIKAPDVSEMAKIETKTCMESGGAYVITVTKDVQPGVKLVTVMRSSDHDWDFVFSGLPTGIDQIESYNELYRQTVPWPRVWLVSHDAVNFETGGGGVRTESVRAVPEELRDGERHRRKADTYPDIVPARCEGSIKPATDHEKLSITKIFQDAWKKEKGPCPTVTKVLAVINEALKQRQDNYKKKLAFSTLEQHFHGTTLKCDITKNIKLCQYSNCGICGICNEGFRNDRISENKFQRFGKGFYLAPASSKSHDYAEGFNGFRAQLLCDVYPGVKYKLKENDQDLTGPPRNYDSVYGMVGKDLNYPELVIYNSAAILPRYVILYR